MIGSFGKLAASFTSSRTLRRALLGVAALGLGFTASTAEAAYQQAVFDPFGLFAPQQQGSALPSADGTSREIVSFPGGHAAGSIIVSTAERRLYFVLPNGQAIRYAVGVGRPGFTWAGVKSVTRKAEWPDWTPPAEMLRRRPDLPRHMKGGEENPLGARAMYLGGSLYRIHGSNEPGSIGQGVSSGCIRMSNEDVVDLYQRVRLGARVVVR